MFRILVRLKLAQFTTCMILHPISYPNKGPIIEQYLAEQAIGLAKSLGWNITKGPFWKKDNPMYIIPHGMRSLKKNQIYIEPSHQEIRDGDYIRTSEGNGFISGNGLQFDPNQSQSDGDLHKEWRDKLLRESLANSSLIKAKKVTKKTYFTKGKLQYISEYLKLNPTDCLFINAELQPVQIRNLKKILEAKLNEVSIAGNYPRSWGGDAESETEFETEEGSELKNRREGEGWKQIRIFDRFSIILQIFAQRSTKKLSKLQIELSYLTYIKTRLVRDGSTYSSHQGVFNGDLMNTQEVTMEIISAKQRRASGMMGEGESQLEIERRNLRDKEAKIRREIEEETRLRKINIDKTKKRTTGIPVVALVGYTNVGKSAFLNYLMKKSEVESKDMLFQTLSTTSRHIMMPSGTRIMLLDTIGFITNLPVEMVESFKTTLEEIAHADLVIHLQDISHPHRDLQKSSVLKILKELKFEPTFYNQKMIEVWNKIDLLDGEMPLQEDTVQDDYAKISCITGEGMKDLMTKIQQKLKVQSGQKPYDIQYGIKHHNSVLKWLKQNTNITYQLQFEFIEGSREFPEGSVKIKVELDALNYGKLDKFLNPERVKDKSKKGMPPKGW